jgi:membrane-associated phospholipid phosphatase
MIVFFTVFLTCCYLVPEFVGAAVRPGQYHLNKEYLSFLVSDFGAVWSSPWRWGKKDLLTFSAVLGTGLVLYAFDQEIHSWIQDHQSSSTRDTAQFVSNFGHGFFLGTLLTGLYASGELAQKKGLRRTALLGLESWLTSGAIVLSLKFVMGRARPKTGKGSYSFKPFSTGSSYYSFPSGHSAAIFSVATVIADQTDSVLVDLCAYGVASAVAVSRISEEKHWISDVFIGSAIGYFVGKKICALHRGRDGDRVKLGFHLSPHSQGLTLTYTF